jgi:undecaprenyl-diphosphatase
MTTSQRYGSDLRFAIGVAGLALSGLPVHDHSIGPVEAAVFRAVNRLPDGLYPPVWVVMQAGNALAPHVAGLGALATGRRRLAARLVVSGTTSWLLAKLVKRIYRRPRPGSFVEDARCRGPEPSGLGYVSGHAAIAMGIAVALGQQLPRPAVVALGPALVSVCRVYVGAHLPLDVAGGAALGLAVDAIVERLLAGYADVGKADAAVPRVAGP